MTPSEKLFILAIVLMILGLLSQQDEDDSK
jgi:hypothetical protein